MKQNQFAMNMPVPTKKMLSSPIHTWICTTKQRNARNWHCWQYGSFKCSPWISLKKIHMILRIGLSAKVIIVRPHCYLCYLCTYGTGSWCCFCLSWSLWTSSRASSFYILFRVMVIKMKGSQKGQEPLYVTSLIWNYNENFHLNKRILKSIKRVKEQNRIWW